MVLMTVGQDNRSDVIAKLFKEIKVRDTDVNSVCGLFRKTHAGIEDQHLIPITHGHAVHPKLADTAERNNLQYTIHLWTLLDSPDYAAVVVLRGQILCKTELGSITHGKLLYPEA